MQLIKQSKLCNLKVAEATSWPSRRSHCSHLLERPTTWPGERPPDDGWCAAGNERLYQAALSSTSRSRQARFLSNCIGFSNFLFQDEWMEILRGEGVGVIVYNPVVIITYDPFSISGLSQHMLVITLGPPFWERFDTRRLFNTMQCCLGKDQQEMTTFSEMCRLGQCKPCEHFISNLDNRTEIIFFKWVKTEETGLLMSPKVSQRHRLPC